MFSVVIPLYNKELSISHTIQSALDQTFQDFEIVIVNDGSTDDGVMMVEKFNDQRIRIIHQENQGVSAARNKGVKEAKNEWIAFLDADDFWDLRYLETMSDLINDYPNAAMYGCAYTEYENGIIHKQQTLPLPKLFRDYVANYFSIAIEGLLYWTSSTIVSKERVLEIGGFDERIHIGEDLVLWFKLALDYDIVFYNIVLSYYNISAENRAMNNQLNFSKSFLKYTSDFKPYELVNDEFRRFINTFRFLKLLDLLQNYQVNNKNVKKFILNIDRQEIPIKWRVFISLPFKMKKIIVKYIYKYPT